ncbi:MAG: stage III sporulation protein AE [Lachnospiraceae bacterium]|nr:stage III sporulation protein AE [Lachnospiraceae bacterium]
MKKIVFALCILFAMCWYGKIVYAEENNDLSVYEIDDIQEFINDELEYKDIDFKNMLEEIMSGSSKNVFKDMFGMVADNVFAELIYNRNALTKIIVLAIISAFFTCFSEAFNTKQITDTGFFVTYTVIMTILIASFMVVCSVAEEMIIILLKYMEVILPSYVLAIGTSVGIGTGTGFYEIMLVVMMGVEYVFLKMVVPAIKLYVVISLLNNILNEDMMSKTMDLIKTFIRWSTKLMMGVVVGVNVVQSMVMPMADMAKGKGLYKVLTFLPGVGSGAKTISEILLGSGVLIKNAIGVAGIVIIVCIVMVPIIKMFVFSICYRFTAAIIQPVSDKKIVRSITGVYEGAEMLMQIMLTTAMIFMLSIVIICVMTNKII